jgi:DNA-binding PadR family transcriptional regulator
MRYRIQDIGDMKLNDDDQERRNHSHHNGGWKQERRIHEKMEQLRRVQFGQRGFLRPQIIQLFQQEPMNGVDIMNRLQDMSHGWYRPSPGAIYPLLEQLEKEGLITKNKDGKYELTSAYADQSGVGDDLTSALSAMESNTSFIEDLLRADPGRLSKCRDRIEKVTKRLDGLNGALQKSGRSP